MNRNHKPILPHKLFSVVRSPQPACSELQQLRATFNGLFWSVIQLNILKKLCYEHKKAFPDR